MEDLDPKIDRENLVFSKDQIEYLRSECERQRQWVNLLSTREQAALEELEETKSSISYRVGRFLTYVPRKILAKRSKAKKKNVYFVNEEDEVQQEMFPSTLLISPELLPSSAATRKTMTLSTSPCVASRAKPPITASTGRQAPLNLQSSPPTEVTLLAMSYSAQNSSSFDMGSKRLAKNGNVILLREPELRLSEQCR